MRPRDFIHALVLMAIGCGPNALDDDASRPVAAADATDGFTDASVPGAAVDANRADATVVKPDADICELCVASSECQQANCDTACEISAVSDGITCAGSEDMICVVGECVVRACGDGYREFGGSPVREGCDDGNVVDGDACSASCAPTLLIVAARAGETDTVSGGASTSVGFDDGGLALVIWKASSGGTEYDIVARRFTGAGVALDAAPITIAPGVGSGWASEPTVVGLTTGWAVVWTELDGDGDVGGIMYAIVSPDGVVGAADVANTSTFLMQNDPSVARLPAGFVVTWSDHSVLSPGTSGIRTRGRIFGEDGAPLGPELAIASGMFNQHESSVAARDTGFIVVWTAASYEGTSSSAIVGRRFDVVGDPVDASAFLISDRDAMGYPVSSVEGAVTRLAAGGWGVAWTSRGDDLDGDIRAATVADSGAMPVGPSLLLQGDVGIAERRASVAALDGSTFAVLSHRGTSPSTLVDIELAVVDGVFAPEFAAVESELADAWIQQFGSLTSAAGRVWVVWSDDNVVAGVPRALVAQVLPVD